MVFMYKKESLELLRQRIDLPEVLAPHVQWHRSGASYKACCPFHEEKTPSFMVQKGDSHYHCFGCGAHGDAIAFLMNYLKMPFVEAIETLAERFQVPLEKEEERQERKGPSKTALKDALEKASRFYHFLLLNSEEGAQALKYLYDRGLDLEFIRLFQVGYAPLNREIFKKTMYAQGVDDATLEDAGLILATAQGRQRDFFIDRITFPIRDAMGNVIGFSARKYKEETFGGKYINTSETLLFKKSHVLFGLSYCRRRIAKERKVIVVEGQIDALRLIHAGFTFTVAGQGTAFGEDHVKELIHLGVNHVYLSMDGDEAGREATVKIGDLFQKKGIEVAVVRLPQGMDPDTVLKEVGPPGYLKLLEEAQDYLSFLFQHLSKQYNLDSPSGKNECVQNIAQKIRKWEQPLMVHESLRKLSQLSHVPENILGIGQELLSDTYVKKAGKISFSDVDPDRVLESDLLRWLFLSGQSIPRLMEIASANLRPEHFKVDVCKRLFSLYLEKPSDLLSLMMHLYTPEEQLFFSEMMQKKVNLQKAEEGISQTIHKILQRRWMEEGEAIKMKIHSGVLSDAEALELAKLLNDLKKNPPQVMK